MPLHLHGPGRIRQSLSPQQVAGEPPLAQSHLHWEPLLSVGWGGGGWGGSGAQADRGGRRGAKRDDMVGASY